METYKKIFKIFIYSSAIIIGINLLGFLGSIADLNFGYNSMFNRITNYRTIIIFQIAIIALIFLNIDKFKIQGIVLRHKYKKPSKYRKLFNILSNIASITIVIILLIGMILIFFNTKFSEWVIRNNFVVSLIIVLVPLATTLRSSIFKMLTWKKLADPWLKWSGVSALAVGGFGFVGLSEEIKNNLLKISVTKTQLQLEILQNIYFAMIFLLALGYLFRLVGYSSSKSEDSQKPLRWFIPAFIFTWLSNLGGYTLVLNSVLLTLAAHLSS